MAKRLEVNRQYFISPHYFHFTASPLFDHGVLRFLCFIYYIIVAIKFSTTTFFCVDKYVYQHS